MKKEDGIKLNWQGRREQAVRFGEAAVEGMLKDYREPVRAGTRRGDLIGFSLVKKRAACLVILHNRHFGLTLKEIAQIAGVDYKVLLVWRTQAEFRKLENEACRMLGEAIAETVRSEIEGIESPKETVLKVWSVGADNKKYPVTEKWKCFAEVLPFLNRLVGIPLIDLIAEKVKMKRPPYPFYYSAVAMWLMRSEEVRDGKTLKRWQKNFETPEWKELRRSSIKSQIKLITNPKVMKALGPKKAQEIVEDFKNFIFRELDL